MQYSSSGRRISFTNLATAIAPSVASTISPGNIGAATLEYGTYVGTGKYGSSNPTHITCSKIYPILMGVSMADDPDSPYWAWGGGYQGTWNSDLVTLWPTTYTEGYGFGNKSRSNSAFIGMYGKKSGKSVYWYHVEDASYQKNRSGVTYMWFAIG